MFTKYFNYAYTAGYTLLIFFSCHLASSIIAASLTSFRSLHKFIIFLLPLGLLVLSFSDIRMPAYVPVIFVVLAFGAIQIGVFKFFENSALKLDYLYMAELLGCIAGTFFWYFFTASLGFKGFAVLMIALMALLTSFDLKRKELVLLFLISIVSVFFFHEPQPLVDKRERYRILPSEECRKVKWDPNSHIEYNSCDLEKNHPMTLILFDGGEMRTNVLKFDADYASLKSNYINSKPSGAWGLDVILPAFMATKPLNNCALISSVGGQEILAAKAFDCQNIFAVDINGSALSAMKTDFLEYSGGLNSANVQSIQMDGRIFINKSAEPFDIIQIYSAHDASFSGTFGQILRTSSLVTAEALRDYEAKLTAEGILNLTQPRFPKILSTFRKAFGQDLIDQGHLLALKKTGPDVGDLNSFYYRKRPWTTEEIEKIRTWLKADSTITWELLSAPQLTAVLQNDDEANLKLYKPSTDNWPFSKIIGDPFKLPVFVDMLIGLAVLLVISLLLLAKNNFRIRYISNLAGIQFSIVQTALIFFIQRQVGNPALGLTLACAAVSGFCIFGIFLSNWLGAYKTKLFALAASFFVIGIQFLTHDNFKSPVVMAAFCIVSVLQSSVFFSTIKVNREHIRVLLVQNSIGVFTGMLLFNVIFVLFGLDQMFLFASICSLLLYPSLFGRKSLSK